VKIKIKKLDPSAIIPTRNHPDDCGLDLYALEDVELYPGTVKKIRTGIAVQLEYNIGEKFGLFIHDRSGLGSKGIHRFAGVVDQSYTGELLIILFNSNSADKSVPFVINKGDKIAQLVIQEILTPEVIEVEKLDETVRGDKGFGSSGK
jgi:dUTP pyrophosphatase